MKNRKGLLFKIEEYHPDIIHAHYGLSGLLANLQREVPVVTTFHGSDIHSGGIWLLLSKICMYLSAFNIFVSRRIYETAKYKKVIMQYCHVEQIHIHSLNFLKMKHVMI